MRIRWHAAACISAALAGVVLPLHLAAGAQAPVVTTVRPVPQRVEGLPDSMVGQPPRAANAAGSSTPGSNTGVAAGSPVADTVPAVDTRRVVLSLRTLGAQGPLTLRGTSELGGVQFGIRSDEVVTAAELTLSGATSPALIPEFSKITVTLNEQYVGTIPARSDQPAFGNLVLPVNPIFFQDNNRLNFHFTGRYTADCNDPLSGLLWSTISDTSTLVLTLQRLPPERTLARLPQPFFDAHEKTPLTLPFVLGDNPAPEALRAAGIVASWFGRLADYRGASFPVMDAPPPDGNAVAVVVGTPPVELGMPPISGPTLAIVANPRDALSSLLVVAGRTPAEAATAATALAAGGESLGTAALGGSSAVVQAPELAARVPYDAPNWIPTNRPVRLGELVTPTDLQSSGYVGTVRVPFRTAPDLYTWFDRTFPLDVGFRAPPGPVIDLGPSRLDVGINGSYLRSFSLADPTLQTGLLARFTALLGMRAGGRVHIPPYDVFGRNDLQFFFDARPLHRGDCVATPGDLQMAVDPDSTIDLSRAYHFAAMPNLAFFVNAGFPFTRMADLSETAVVLPDRPTSLELGAFLDLMGQMGALTGYPVFGVTVEHANQAAALGDRDVLLMGTLDRLGAAAALLEASGLKIEGRDRLSLALPGALDQLRDFMGYGAPDDRDRLAQRLTTTLSPEAALLVGTESPLQSGRSVVAFLGATPKGLADIMPALRDSARAPLVQGSLTLFSGGKITAYRVGSTYTVGHLAFWVWPNWWLRDQALGIMGVMVLGCVVLAWVLVRVLARHQAARLGRRRRTP